MSGDIFIPRFERPVRIPSKVKLGFAKPQIAFAGSRTNLKLTFHIPAEIKPDDTIKLQLFGGRNNKGFFQNIQCDDERKDGFVRVKYNDIFLKISQKENPYGTIKIFPPGSGIKKGSFISVSLRNIEVQKPSILNKFFVLYHDSLLTPQGPHKAETVWNQENQKKILSACLMHILGGKISHFKIHAPSNITPGKKFTVLIRPEDKFFNLSSQIPEKKIEIFNGKEKLKGRIERVKNSSCLKIETSLKNSGVYRLVAKYGKKSFTSNPMICSESEKYNLYWGLLHGHTEMSDGAGSIDHYFHQLKNEARLDFGAPGDHDHTWETTDQMWKKICKTVKKWHKESEFITFLGYEWAKWRRNGDGDRNVYYYFDDRPMYRSDEGHYPNPAALFEALKKEKAIIIPHHTAHGGNFCDWKDHDIEKERLIEIYQERGSYECSEKEGNVVPECKSTWQPYEKGYVVNALIAGWRVGFTGGGDDHIGHAGIDFPRGSCNYKDGLTGVFAKELTKKGIWDGLWNRRTIATTGARIYLYYEINNKPLGSEIDKKHAEMRAFRIVFHGTDTLDRIDIIRNGKVVATISEKKQDLELCWQDSTPLNQILLPPTKFSKEPFAFYYIRAIQKDREVAWASPVWIIDPKIG